MRADSSPSPGAPGPRPIPPRGPGLNPRAIKTGTVAALPGSAFLNFPAWRGTRRPFNPGRIPEELKELRQWLGWRHEKDESGKPTKHPYILHAPGRMARSNDQKTWNTFDKALSVVNRFSGLGLVLTAADSWTCIDLDHCLNKITGIIEPWARDIVTELNSYTEISPSGEGLHIWVRGKVVDTKKKKGNVEIFFAGFYLTMTGHHLPGTPTTIEDRQAELDALHDQVFAKPTPNLLPASDSGATVVIHDADLLPAEDERPTGPLTDDELIAKAHRAANGEKFGRLWRGDVSGHGNDDNVADMALAGMLAFWCGPDPDPARIDRLFRKSGLMRDKWDRPTAGSTYGAVPLIKFWPARRSFTTLPRLRPRLRPRPKLTKLLPKLI